MCVARSPPAWVARHMLTDWRCKELASGHDSEDFVPSRLGVGCFLFRTVKYLRSSPDLSQFTALGAPLDMRANVDDGESCAHSELIPWLTSSIASLALQHQKGPLATFHPLAPFHPPVKLNVWRRSRRR